LLDAGEALGLGIVSQVCDDVVAEALRLAATIAANPPAAVAATRTNVYRAMELAFEAEILEQEPRSQALALHGPEFPDAYATWRTQIQGTT
ncbi:MAG TPA: hypothetical protein VI854_05810, partial [Acidimicrobiia bacterium]|nr:hypothetical protein [Acidimicrobiia bacterium]